MTEYPSLAAALAAVQAKLPEIHKGETAEVEGTSKTGIKYKYKYKYADLADVSRVILPMLGAVGLSWVTRPTLKDGGGFVLAYELMHVSGDGLKGEYPLPDRGSPQEIGSAITYARRYALCSVTGVAPEADDDDGASASQRPAQRDQWDNAQPARPSHDEEVNRATAAILRAVNEAQLTAITGIVQQRLDEGVFTVDDARSLLDVVDQRRSGLTRLASEQPDQCESCRTGTPCPVCEGKGCGSCPDCSPQVPEWTK